MPAAVAVGATTVEMSPALTQQRFGKGGKQEGGSEEVGRERESERESN